MVIVMAVMVVSCCSSFLFLSGELVQQVGVAVVVVHSYCFALFVLVVDWYSSSSAGLKEQVVGMVISLIVVYSCCSVVSAGLKKQVLVVLLRLVERMELSKHLRTMRIMVKE